MSDRKSYWSSSNPADYKKEYHELFDKLVPSMGNCLTIEGELLRAVSRIGHDYYNNGFGNVWSSTHAYLRDFKKNNPEIAGDMNTGNSLSALAPYKYGRMLPAYKANLSDDQKERRKQQRIKIEDALLRLTDECVKLVIAQNGNYHPNTVDCLDYDRSPKPVNTASRQRRSRPKVSGGW
jgi:hypothetical protein